MKKLMPLKFLTQNSHSNSKIQYRPQGILSELYSFNEHALYFPVEALLKISFDFTILQ